MKYFLSVILFFFLFFNSFAENLNDSLLKVYRTSKDETERITAYSKLTISMYRKNPDSSKKMLDSLERWVYRNGEKMLIARYLDNKGSFYWFQGKYDSAVFQYHLCIEYCKKNNLIEREVNAKTNLGALYKNLSNFDSAAYYLTEAYVLTDQIDDNHLIAKLTYDLGALYSIRGYYLPASEYYLKALDLLKNNKDKRLELNVYMGLGVLYQRMNKAQLSIQYSLKALALDLQNDDLDELSDIYNNLGVVYWINAKEYDTARYYMDKALELYKIEGNLNNTFTVLINIGGLELDLKNYENAFKYFREAKQLKLSFDDKYKRAALMINMGKAFTKTHHFDSAYNYCYKGLDIAKEIGALEWIKNAYLALVELDTLSGDFKSAFRNSMLSNQFSDSISNENVRNKVAELEIVFQTKQKEKDIKNLKMQNDLNHTIITKQRYLVFSILFATFLLLVFLYYVNRNRKKLKSLNEQLTVKNFEISNNNNLLEEQKIELSTLNQTKDKFLSVIAHDLRSPFNSLLGFLEILEHEFWTMDEGERLGIIKTLNHSAQNTYNLLVNLLEWSSAQRGNIANHPENFDLRAISAISVDLLAGRALEKNHTINNEIPVRINVFADPTLTQSMFINLVNNAIKFTPANGTINITCSDSKNFVEICIADNGIGIPEEFIPGIFGLESGIKRRGTNNELGTGLGLILCKEFIKIIGGDIRIESKSGDGTKFYFTIPKAK